MRDRPERRHLPNVARQAEQIDAHLRSVFHDLRTGAAPWPLLLHGAAGTGKTCAALSLLDWTDGATRYYTVEDLCKRLIVVMNAEAFWPGATGGRIFEGDFWRDWERAALTLLDEIGTRDRVSDHQYTTLKRAIDGRVGRPAVYISNLSPAQIAAVYDGRIASRLCAGTVIELAGPDRRLKRTPAY